MADFVSSKSTRKMPEGGSRLVYNLLSIIFLLAMVSLICTVFVPKLYNAMDYREEAPIDYVISIDENVIVIPVPIDDPGPVIGPHNMPKETTVLDEETTKSTGEETDKPEPTTQTVPQTTVPQTTVSQTTVPQTTVSQTTVLQPTKPPRIREPHPEELDEDDLPLLYAGRNPRPSNKRIRYRLANWIRPIGYDMRLIVGVRGHNGADKSSVKGNGSITFKVEGEASNLLEIHAEFFIETNFTSLKAENGARYIASIHQFYNEQKRTYSILFDQPLTDGETYTLVLNWIASIGHSTMGLYETWYFDGDTNRYSLTSHGQPMSTRKWMPCFDEPALKAILSLEVTHPSSLIARSNGRIMSTDSQIERNLTKTTFAPTLFPISPYLYALTVTDFVEMNDTVEGIPISVILPPIFKTKLALCLQLAIRSVNAYLSALNSSKIFDKMDFVFVPDHGSAMENVGHITFATKYIDDYSTYAHEMMHNYLGNLITLSWWDEVWINEGLTTMYEIDAVHGIDTKGAIENYRDCRRKDMTELDAYRKTTPLKFDVSTEVEARANFKGKPYNKGAVVLNMIRAVVGEKEWKEGIELFLRKFEYKSVDGMDFINTITEVHSKYVESSQLTADMAHTFFNNRGFPLVRITRKEGKLMATQERFHRGFIKGNQKENKQLWTIPLHLVKMDGTSRAKIEFITGRTLIIDSNETLVLDPTKVVYYRAIYDEEVYREIARSNLSETYKNEIVNDLLYAAYSGYVDADLAYSVFALMENKLLRDTVWKLHSGITLLQPNRLYKKYQIFHGKDNQTEFDEWKNAMYMQEKKYCEGIATQTDVIARYEKNRESGLKAFLCPQILSTSKIWLEKLIETGLDLSKQQTIHPIDIETLIKKYNQLTENIIVNIVLKLATLIKDEFVLAELIMRAGKGIDSRSTDQLSKLAKLAPGAARQNAVLITRIFNERHAIETEDRILGDKLDKALQKAFSRKLKSRNS